jgi:hypothetical protein
MDDESQWDVPLPGHVGDCKAHPEDQHFTQRTVLFFDDMPCQVVSMNAVTVDGVLYERYHDTRDGGHARLMIQVMPLGAGSARNCQDMYFSREQEHWWPREEVEFYGPWEPFP